MPRGFLVKRNRRSSSSYRPRSISTSPREEEEDDAAAAAVMEPRVWRVFQVEPPALIPGTTRRDTSSWGSHVESALEAEADRRAQLPEGDLVLTRDRVQEVDARSPVKPVGTRLPEDEAIQVTTPEFQFPTNSLSIERLLAGNVAPTRGHFEKFDSNFPRAYPPDPRRERPRAAPKKPKTNRRLTFEDEVTTSPVLGLQIKKEGPELKRVRERSSQPLGEFICQLCKEEYTDPFSLAQHKCCRIVRVEYRCPECDKVFSCPANLASHRRWHKPRPVSQTREKENLQVHHQHRDSSRDPDQYARPAPAPADAPQSSALTLDPPPPPLLLQRPSWPEPEEEVFDCRYCGKKFRRRAFLRKHLAAHELGATTTTAPPTYGHVFVCHLCGARFPSAEIRDKHRLWHEMRGEVLAGLRPEVFEPRTQQQQIFACTSCLCTFFSPTGLTRHVSKFHPQREGATGQ